MVSASEKAAETATEVISATAEEAAEQMVNFAEFTRNLNKAKVQFYLLGMAVGGVTGAVVAFRVAYLKAERKYAKIADDDIDEIREHYQAKARALEAEAAKRPVEEIVKERGYSSPEKEASAPPMAIQPPLTVAETEDTVAGEPPDEPEPQNIFEEAQVTHEWDWHEERKKRSPDIPYVIHADERFETEEYSDVTLTYYDGDDVLCNERDEIVDPNDIDRLVGERNLYRFGHGSGDASIVYIRNDELTIIYEVIKSPNNYAEEVHGFSHDDVYYRNLERMRARERDDQDD